MKTDIIISRQKDSLLIKYLIIMFILFLNNLSQGQNLKIQTIPGHNVASAKKYFDSGKIDPIEGIWLSSDGYTISIEKKIEKGVHQNKKYCAIIISCNYKNDVWEATKIRAFIEKTTGANIYYIDYFTSGIESTEIHTCKGFLNESSSLFSFTIDQSSGENHWEKIYPENQDKTITTQDILSPGYGTGFILSSDGYLATCLHVVNHAKSINIYGLNGDFQHKFKAEIIITDEQYDLAILKINNKSLKIPSLPFSINTAEVQEGEEVFTAGFPNIKSIPEKANISNGIITATKGLNGDNTSFRISTSLDHGNSGGPLFDSKGNLTGIVFMKISNVENIGYAIKAGKLKKLFEAKSKNSVLNLTKNSVAEKSLTERAKTLSKFSCIVEVNNYFEIYNASNTINVLSDTFWGSHEESDPDTYYSLAYYQIQAKEYDSSYTNFSRAINKGINKTEAYYMRGYLGAYLKKDAKLVISDMNRCFLQDSFVTANSYLSRGDAYNMLGMSDSAISDYTKCIEKDSTVLDAYLKRGELRSAANDCEEAVLDMNKIIETIKNSSKKSYAKIYSRKGECLLKLNQPEEALESANTAIEIDGANAEIWTLRGKIYFSLKKYELSIADFSKAIKIEENEESYTWRGKAKIEIGKNSEGKKDISKANEIAQNIKKQ